MVEVQEQLYCFLMFILVGSIVGILFDIFRVIRQSFTNSDLMTTLEDVIFCIISGSIILISLFLFNNGEVRNYIIIGIVFGLLIYFKLLGKILRKYLLKIFLIIRKIMNIILVKPFCKLEEKVINNIKKIKNDISRQNATKDSKTNKIKCKKLEKIFKKSRNKKTYML